MAHLVCSLKFAPKIFTKGQKVFFWYFKYHVGSNIFIYYLSNTGKPDWITVVPLPDTFRGKYSQDIYAAQKYAEEAKLVIQKGMATGGEVNQIKILSVEISSLKISRLPAFYQNRFLWYKGWSYHQLAGCQIFTGKNKIMHIIFCNIEIFS